MIKNTSFGQTCDPILGGVVAYFEHLFLENAFDGEMRAGTSKRVGQYDRHAFHKA